MISDFFQNIEQVLSNIFNSIRTENPESLDAAETIISRISLQVKSYQLGDPNILKDSPACNGTVKKDLVSRLEKILFNLSRLINLFKEKSNKHVLFSEKAIGELEYLVRTIKHLSRCLKDATITKNDVLTKYIIDTANSLENTAASFAVEHEERLLSGVCQSQSSAVFIDLLNTIKENSYHFKEMGRQVSCFM